jgi:biopolymer transport protein ExbD
MSAKALLRAGMLAVLTAGVLFWCVPIWVRFFEVAPPGNGIIVYSMCWFRFSLLATGALLILRAGIGEIAVRRGWNRELRLFPDTAMGKAWLRSGRRARSVHSQLPDLGLFLGTVPLVLSTVFMVLQSWPPQSGLLIHLRTQPPMEWAKSPWTESLGVYLAKDGKFYSNGRLVVREQLRQRLVEELGKRAEWTVYFEADYDAVNEEAIFAIDTIQGTGATLVWVTPGVREELKRKQEAKEKAAR